MLELRPERHLSHGPLIQVMFQLLSFADDDLSMNGLEIALRMRGEPSLSRTMLIALTGYGQEDDKRRSQEAGFDAHLVKPIAPEELLQLLGAEVTVPSGRR